jgi:hypothetical protein
VDCSGPAGTATVSGLSNCGTPVGLCATMTFDSFYSYPGGCAWVWISCDCGAFDISYDTNTSTWSATMPEACGGGAPQGPASINITCSGGTITGTVSRSYNQTCTDPNPPYGPIIIPYTITITF